MFHTIKKAANVYKPSIPESDSEFNDLSAKFNNVVKHLQALLTAFKGQRTVWSNIKSNTKQALDATNNAFTADVRPKQLANIGNEILENWDQQAQGLRESQTETRVIEAENYLNEYIAYVKTIQAQIKQRNTVLEELNYYKGKKEDLSSKGASKPKEEERLRKTEMNLQDKERQYEQTNNETKEKLYIAAELKDEVFMRCIVAFVDIQRRIMEKNPFSEMLEGYQDVLQGEWPAISSFQPSQAYQPTQNYQAQRQSSVPDTKQMSGAIYPPNVSAPHAAPRALSDVKQVRALYDFEPENNEELRLKAGDIVELREELDENWMFGVVGGREGIFPSNYVEPL
eukprot:CFRG7278T1